MLRVQCLVGKQYLGQLPFITNFGITWRIGYTDTHYESNMKIGKTCINIVFYPKFSNHFTVRYLKTAWT